MFPFSRSGHAAVLLVVLVILVLLVESSSRAFPFDPRPSSFLARDAGVRTDPINVGGPLPDLTEAEHKAFGAGLEAFLEVQSVQGTIPDTEAGLGPRFNLDSCAGCHVQPAIGGTSPFTNPQVAVANLEGATNEVPSFITLDGPVREARFKRNPDGTPDGGVHALYTITGRHDAPGCQLAQPDFERAERARNLVFRIPTPVFGSGLIEAIEDRTILENMRDGAWLKRQLGIAGHPNTSGNDGTITRFGWKAQNKSLNIFSGEAYNVEQGVTNDLFPTERDETQGCLFNPTPEDAADPDADDPTEALGDFTQFAVFMRFLAPPSPADDTPSIERGRAFFKAVGCALCHTPSLHTGNATSAALRNKEANLYSDLLVHHMGWTLADGISQGQAGPDEFRTAPLWGLGARIFFLHDGRTTDLLEAIEAHASRGHGAYPPSEANEVIRKFTALRESHKQDMLDFLRAL